MNNFHVSVLLQETIAALRVEKDKKYIDATLGGGGHSFEILRSGGIVLGIDIDTDALGFVRRKWKIESRKWKIKEENLTLVRGNFREIDKIAHLNNFDPPTGRVSGIIFDLGVSSHQLEEKNRGFSFQKEGPLDMRMDRELSVKALDLIRILTKKQFYDIFTKFGEENRAWEISDRIVRARNVGPIKTTRDLAEIIERSNRKFSRIHAATKIFQALRIVVNDELNALEESLPKAVRLLDRNGRLAIISFHSLEDRIVKKAFLKFEEQKLGKIITEKPIVPGETEIKRNRRARSAKLRVFEKV